MTHSLINTGAGWACIECKRAWDQGESAPEECRPDLYPFNTATDEADAVFFGRIVADMVEYRPLRMIDASRSGDPLMAAAFPGPLTYSDGVTLRQQALNPMATQIGGRHYADLAIQPTEFCMRNGLDFCVGSILKYVTRHRAKNGVEDLRKARHFTQIRQQFALDIQPTRYIAITMLEYVTRNQVRPDDAEALYRLEAYYNGLTAKARDVGATRLTGEIDNLIDQSCLTA